MRIKFLLFMYVDTNILYAKNLAPPTFLHLFLQFEEFYEILKLSLTSANNSLYFNVFPLNLSFVVLSLQLKLEKPVFHVCVVHFKREMNYFCIFLTVRV